MDAFASFVRTYRGTLRAAIAHAARTLGIDRALDGPLTCGALAHRIDVRARRLGPLLDALVLEGFLARIGDRFSLVAPLPDARLADTGWGRLAEVIRSDRALDPHDGPELLGRYQTVMRDAQRETAAALALQVTGSLDAGATVLDLGAGLGTYGEAIARLRPDVEVVAIDRAEVVALGGTGDVRWLAGDVRTVELPPAQLVLSCDLLHHLSPSDQRGVLRRMREALPAGGRAIVKEIRLDADRFGPAVGVWFALDLALYSPEGELPDAATLEALLRAAEFDDVSGMPFETAPDSIVLAGA